MSVLAVIPARIGSHRLPGKPLRLLGGAPLIVRVWQRVASMAVADRVVVATDSAEVADIVRRAGGEATLTREDHPSGTDRVAEVATRTPYEGFDVVLNVQGDEPFVPVEAARGAVGVVTGGSFALGTAAFPATPAALDEPSVVKVVRADDGRALYFSRAAIPHLRDPGDRSLRDRLVLRHVGVYAYTREALAAWVALPEHPLERVERLEQLRPLAAGFPIGIAVGGQSRDAAASDGSLLGGIDTEDELARANARWSAISDRRD